MNKILFVTLCLVAGAFGAAVQQHILAEGPKCPLDDPFRQTKNPFPINITFPPVVVLDHGSQVENLVVEGLSTFKYKVNLNVLSVNFEIMLPKVTGNATYKAEGFVDARPLRHETLPSGNFTGHGLGKVAATGVDIKGSATIVLTITGKIQLARLTLNTAKFDSLALDFGDNWVIGGSKVNWDELSRNIKGNFEQDWAQHKTALTQKVRESLNASLRKFSLQDLIDFIGGDDGSQC